MVLDADALAARRRLKRRLSLWRFVAVIAILAVLVTAGLTSLGAGYFDRFASHVARVDITGIIVNDEKQQELLDEIAEAEQVKAVILRIDSPGGTTVGAEALYGKIRKIAADKPVVAVMGTVAASGGYLVAVAGDHIVARGNTTTGSIGVIFQWAQVEDLLTSLGVTVESVKSGPLKAVPSPFEPTTDAARAVTQGMVDDAYDWFVGLVAERRPFDAATARRLADGRVYSGRQALKEKLIDEIGGEAQARDWLEAERGISKDLQAVDWKVEEDDELSLVPLGLAWLARSAGLPGVANLIASTGKTLRAERLSLDGLISVWQAPD
ncbi:signal peptide peptidase SppA [Kaustia mangrovi]|uniref:Signal peptide peptidase SppA n=1 Tax=Kaustia mangrovi TaxID=2593653 RepID=A0A7S8C3B6_9HYPH|nr:signal peptide peptidase SppA [Kaustia mangrovi]QPC42572.1 signal peptide peptidase SppA [Kaustia mangrovi]